MQHFARAPTALAGLKTCFYVARFELPGCLVGAYKMLQQRAGNVKNAAGKCSKNINGSAYSCIHKCQRGSM